MVDEVFARLALLTAAKEHAMRHDGSYLAVGLQHGQHMLHKHEVGLLAFLRRPHRKPPLILNFLAQVVLTEGRVGQHAIKPQQVAFVVLVLGVTQGVLLPDLLRVGNAVQQHVHFADRPRGADTLLPEEGPIERTAPALADVVGRLDEHAAGTAGGIVDAHAFLRVDDLDERAHHVGGGVELPGLLPGGIGEELDQ